MQDLKWPLPLNALSFSICFYPCRIDKGHIWINLRLFLNLLHCDHFYFKSTFVDATCITISGHLNVFRWHNFVIIMMSYKLLNGIFCHVIQKITLQIVILIEWPCLSIHFFYVYAMMMSMYVLKIPRWISFCIVCNSN